MAKRIIVLDQPNDDPSRFRVLYWLNVTAGREVFYAKAGAVSMWAGASAGENSAIAAGTISEQEDAYSRPDGAGLAQVQADLEANWTARQAQLDAYNPWNRYGSFFDSVTGWTLTGVS
jgi:hypothetical protein